MSASVRLEQSKIAAQSVAHNMREIQQRQKTLEKEGMFRTLKGKKRGLKRRIDESTWSKRIHVVTNPPHPAKIVDEDTFATKGVLAVPLDSSAQAAAPTTITDNLRGYATKLRENVQDRPQTFAVAAKTLREQLPGLELALRGASMTTTAFVDMFGDLLSRNGRTITAA
jgi:SOS-response transcriptional repressor LexA